jgi:hypothetical protein
MKFIRPDIDYIWNLDSDEVYKTEDLIKVIDLLKREKPTSVGLRSCSFYGGFDDFLTGFELKTDNFLRIFRYVDGSTWLTHRPPTIQYPVDSKIQRKHISSDQLYEMTGVQMYHYSYVFPDQVFRKINYYKDSVSRQNCIDNYFETVYLPWVLATTEKRKRIEYGYKGVHEFKPEVRGECYTERFTGSHPESITSNLEVLKREFKSQLEKHL